MLSSYYILIPLDWSCLSFFLVPFLRFVFHRRSFLVIFHQSIPFASIFFYDRWERSRGSGKEEGDPPNYASFDSQLVKNKQKGKNGFDDDDKSDFPFCCGVWSKKKKINNEIRTGASALLSRSGGCLHGPISRDFFEICFLHILSRFFCPSLFFQNYQKMVIELW